MKVLCNLGQAKANQRLNLYYNNLVGYSYHIFQLDIFEHRNMSCLFHMVSMLHIAQNMVGFIGVLPLFPFRRLQDVQYLWSDHRPAVSQVLPGVAIFGLRQVLNLAMENPFTHHG